MADNKPVKKFQAGGVSCAVWENQGNGDNQSAYLTVTIDRRYKDKDGEWQSTSALRQNDVPKGLLVLQKAYDFMVTKEPATAEEEEDNSSSSSAS